MASPPTRDTHQVRLRKLVESVTIERQGIDLAALESRLKERKNSETTDPGRGTAVTKEFANVQPMVEERPVHEHVAQRR